ncbi:hypothetical protein RUM43_000383 [Polyplax serrata]|uniref:Uncharacterized protein n=1 Tax=Polyplax serrata TaxID=468196 RepID=A0AAN8SFV1_POLSC
MGTDYSVNLPKLVKVYVWLSACVYACVCVSPNSPPKGKEKYSSLIFHQRKRIKKLVQAGRTSPGDVGWLKLNGPLARLNLLDLIWGGQEQGGDLSLNGISNET